MSSYLVNFIIKNFLPNFLEINPKQTYISLLAGEFILKNVKIKQKLLEYINIDYLEIVNGYIGSIKIIINLLNFYSNPIKIYIDDLYIFSKQKEIDNIDEKERINLLISSKISNLATDEDLFQNINNIIDTSDNFVNQIIRNLNIFINNIVFRFEDGISNKNYLFSLGIIIKSFKFVSLSELQDDIYKTRENDDNKSISKRSSKKSIIVTNNIGISDNPYEICDKKIIIKDFYLYMDCFNNTKKMSFKNNIDIKMKTKIPDNIKNYIADIIDFYSYCQSELNIHCKKKNSHEYIFYNLKLDINFSMNFNIENNNPLYQIIINDIKNFEIDLKLKQLSLFFNLLSYYNLYYYYLIGLNRTIFNLTLSEEEQKRYIFDYIDYYYNKYIIKNNNCSVSSFIKEKEENMTYDDIKKLRKIGINYIGLYKELKEKEEQLKNLKNKWFFKDAEEITNVENQIKEIKNL